MPSSIPMDIHSISLHPLSCNCTALLILGMILVWVISICSKYINLMFWTAKCHAMIAHKQGIRGPKPCILLGNVMDMKRLRESVPDTLPGFKRHDLILKQLLPEHVMWTQKYGKRHLIWWGPNANIVTTDMEVLKEILSSKHTYTLGKPTLLQRFLEPVTGIGLILANGEAWAHGRRIIGPAFHTERLKAFASIMVNITENMVKGWYDAIGDGDEAEIEMEQCMVKLTADIIAHTQFGSSYKRGRKIFKYIEETKEFVYKYGHWLIIPGISYLPIPPFIRLRKIKSYIEMQIREIIQERKAAVRSGKTVYGSDLLGLMLSESERTDQSKSLTMQQLVDECKTFFFAGHETTAQLLIWALLSLAHNTTWQDKARAEVMSVCKDNEHVDYESASKMKIVEMVLYETLRLFAPANSIVRVALCDMKVGDLCVPKGMSFWIPITAIHLDPELWGEGVYEFNPGRFSEGISKAAKHPMAYLPFAYGPRNCIGQSFALMEAKLVLGTLLSRFSFSPSPSYKHSPQLMITMRPKYGAPIIVKKLSY